MIDRPSRIVVLEDEESDIIFITKAFERGRLEHEVSAHRTGEGMLAHLAECHEAGVMPDLLLVDLSLPGMSGLDVLAAVRGSDKFPGLVVIMLTSSSYQREVDHAYTAGANAYVTKPMRLKDLDQLVTHIEDFWLSVAQRPYV